MIWLRAGLSALFLLSFLAPGLAAQPKMEFETPTHDFGRLESGSARDHVFWFKNTGTETLEILKVDSKCGCFIAGDYDKKVEPGKRGKIAVRFETRRFKGKISKPMLAMTNMPGRSGVKFSVEAEIYDPIAIEPRTVGFGSTGRDTAEVRYVTVTNNLKEALELGKPTCDSDRFVVSLETKEAGRTWSLEVRTVAPLNFGLNRGRILIGTDSEKHPQLEVVAAAYVPPPVMVSPSNIRLNPNSPARVKRTVFIRHGKGKAFQITGLSLRGKELVGETDLTKLSATVAEGVHRIESPGGFEARVVPDASGKGYRLVVLVPEQYELPEEGYTVVLTTDEKAYPRVTVPVKAVIIKRLQNAPKGKLAEAQLDRDMEREERKAMKRAAQRARRADRGAKKGEKKDPKKD